MMRRTETEKSSAIRDHWTLDPSITFLNHGSFGATPGAILRVQDHYRARLEAEPVRFMTRELDALLDASREELARFLGARPEGLAFVPNATAGVNAVLRSLELEPGDELLTTTQEYNACRNALEYVCARSGSRPVVVDLPFPTTGPAEIAGRILERVGRRTRLVLVDHVTSQTALVFPIERIATELRERGVDLLVDGAHAPGMIPLDLETLGAAYYTGNCHKWICAPKGAAFLSVRGDRRDSVRPVSISHGANSTRTDRSRFLLEFDWTGTFDPTAWLSVGDSIRFMGSLLPGGWPELMRHNHELALRGRDLLTHALAIPSPAPDSMLGSMAALPLPDGNAATAPSLYGDPLQDALLERHAIEVPVVPWPAPPARVLRISAQIYNAPKEYERLAAALVELLGEEKTKGGR
ncbi:MAG TPA: aminotransferase class V-fold PLP-dependent enzyme [Thermoanaerobaculia bacterium]|nr:aminotransferase class V-fold PLP-dependent enzyme [Thermoanaerobaculia bacterium]